MEKQEFYGESLWLAFFLDAKPDAKMPEFTPEKIEALVAIGIVDPVNSKWRRMPSVWDWPVKEAEWICWCKAKPKRVAIAKIPDHNLLVGQCSECGLISWSLWMSPEKTWDGATQVEGARPMYEKGRGV